MSAPEPTGPERPGRAGWAAIALGCLAIGWGLWQLFVVSPRATRPMVAVIWLAAGLLAHDAVLAPLTMAAGSALGRRLGPRRRRALAASALLVTSLVLVAAPGWLRP